MPRPLWTTRGGRSADRGAARGGAGGRAPRRPGGGGDPRRVAACVGRITASRLPPPDELETLPSPLRRMPSACPEARCSTSRKARCTGLLRSGGERWAASSSSMSSEGALRNGMALGGARLPIAVDLFLTRRRSRRRSLLCAAFVPRRLFQLRKQVRMYCGKARKGPHRR